MKKDDLILEILKKYEEKHKKTFTHIEAVKARAEVYKVALQTVKEPKIKKLIDKAKQNGVE